MLPAIAVSAIALVGCGNANDTPPHNAEEAKAVQEVGSRTPQQQIEAAENSPLPADQKAALIKSIKEKNGLK